MIKLKNDKPIVGPIYKVPEVLIEDVETEIRELISNGIIRESASFYSSPSFVVRNSNGKLRLLIDYQKINENAISEIYHCRNLRKGGWNLTRS